MRRLRPFYPTAALVGAAVAATLLSTQLSMLPARAQAAHPRGESTNSDAAKPEAGATVGAGNIASVGPANAPQQRGLPAKTIEAVKQVAQSAGDIFNRVPCLPSKGAPKTIGSLPHVAGKLAAGQPVEIIAFGSSSTAGFGASSPEFNYPNRLSAQLRRQYPSARITVVNCGKGGEDPPELMKRVPTEVIGMQPELASWPAGTNGPLRNLD